MIDGAVKLLEQYFDLFDRYDNEVDFQTYRNYRSRDIARMGFGTFLFYMAAADGSITEEECRLIKMLLYWDLTPQEVADLISERGINESNFSEKPSALIKLACTMDAKLKFGIDNSMAMMTLSIYDMLGKLMVIADNNATEDEYNAFDKYMRMLIDYVENNFDGSGVREIPYYLQVDYTIIDDDDYGPGGTPVETTVTADVQDEAIEYDIINDSASEDYELLSSHPVVDEIDDQEIIGDSLPLEISLPTPTPQPAGIGEDVEEAKPQKPKRKYTRKTEIIDDEEYPTDNSTPKNVPSSKTKEPKEQSIKQLLAELEGLIGLDTVKEDVRSLINLVKIMKLREKKGMKKIPVSLHLVFSGNPGTGKTTVARLLAKIYQKIGILSTGQLVEVDRSGLVAGYVGQTAAKTSAIIKKAMGGILFIDEAYSLTNNVAKEDFGQEAVDTILKAMEDNRDDFVVIVAGYPKLMEDFVNSNPGLKSRFNKFFIFEDYTPDELKAIFAKLCKDNQYKPTTSVMNYVHDYFREKYVMRDENFANGREVRNFFEKAVAKQANRLAELTYATEEELAELILDDVKGI